jgi:DNA-binding CsgD family transcriptional regulator
MSVLVARAFPFLDPDPLPEEPRASPHLEGWLAEALIGRLALAGLDRLALATLVVNPDAVILYCNAAARALLESDDAVLLDGTGLRFAPLSLNGAFEAALRKATRSPARATLLPLQGRRGMREVAVSPLNGSEPPAVSAGSLALVLIAPPQPDEKSIAQRARRLYGLTEAEARVTAALAAGATVEKVARQHHVHVSTVRAQLRAIFEKTGVNRQTDLVRLALGGTPLAVGAEL